jgi:hypothetical protein
VRGDLHSRLRALLGRGEPAAIPVADAPYLQAAARRTRAVRLVLALVLVAATAAAFVSAPRSPGRRYLPARSVGIVVLDVSSSVRPSTYWRIEAALDRIASSKGRLGLVLFSDVAYAALPTGSPATALKPFLRFFAPPGKGSGVYLANSPWQKWFSAGTRISQGLFLADHMLQSEHARRGAVLLISDLADDPEDEDSLKASVLELEQRGVPLEIVALDPTIGNANYFKNLLGNAAIFQTASLPTGAQARGTIEVTGGFPVGLAVLAGVVVLLLAVDEWWAEPFRFRRRAA